MIADSDVTCLILGETGTGKELFARAIHYLSARRHKPFVPVNCGAIPDLLIENELFGHARGAYTDASSPEEGLLAYAEGGTLFLDEVGTLSACAQVKLLRVLQEREYRPVGSPKPVRMNVRILAATNKNLRSFVEARLFREDLFYRLNVLWLNVPALRDHQEDIPLLAEYFLRLYGERHHRPDLYLDSGAMDRLLAYAWPGNVREMQGILQRAVLLSTHACLTADDIGLPDARPDKALSLKIAKDRAIAQFECKYLSEVLYRCKGNISQAAQVAGKERRTFQRLLKKHRIAGATFRSGAI
jgi:DNA-binding NtrC family response regulator